MTFSRNGTSVRSFTATPGSCSDVSRSLRCRVASRHSRALRGTRVAASVLRPRDRLYDPGIGPRGRPAMAVTGPWKLYVTAHRGCRCPRCGAIRDAGTAAWRDCGYRPQAGSNGSHRSNPLPSNGRLPCRCPPLIRRTVHLTCGRWEPPHQAYSTCQKSMCYCGGLVVPRAPHQTAPDPQLSGAVDLCVCARAGDHMQYARATSPSASQQIGPVSVKARVPS
jgi:hypothetical protein